MNPPPTNLPGQQAIPGATPAESDAVQALLVDVQNLFEAPEGPSEGPLLPPQALTTLLLSAVRAGAALQGSGTVPGDCVGPEELKVLQDALEDAQTERNEALTAAATHLRDKELIQARFEAAGRDHLRRAQALEKAQKDLAHCKASMVARVEYDAVKAQAKELERRMAQIVSLARELTSTK